MADSDGFCSRSWALGVFLYKALTLVLVLPGEKSDLWDVGAPVELSGLGDRTQDGGQGQAEEQELTRGVGRLAARSGR